MNIPARKNCHFGEMETHIPVDWELSFRAPGTGLKPLGGSIASRSDAVKPLTRRDAAAGFTASDRDVILLVRFP